MSDKCDVGSITNGTTESTKDAFASPSIVNASLCLLQGKYSGCPRFLFRCDVRHHKRGRRSPRKTHLPLLRLSMRSLCLLPRQQQRKLLNTFRCDIQHHTREVAVHKRRVRHCCDCQCVRRCLLPRQIRRSPCIGWQQRCAASQAGRSSQRKTHSPVLRLSMCLRCLLQGVDGGVRSGADKSNV